MRSAEAYGGDCSTIPLLCLFSFTSFSQPKRDSSRDFLKAILYIRVCLRENLICNRVPEVELGNRI